MIESTATIEIIKPELLQVIPFRMFLVILLTMV